MFYIFFIKKKLRLRKAFAQKAAQASNWIERQIAAVTSLGSQRGKLEDQLNRLKVIEKEVSEAII